MVIAEFVAYHGEAAPIVHEHHCLAFSNPTSNDTLYVGLVIELGDGDTVGPWNFVHGF